MVRFVASLLAMSLLLAACQASGPTPRVTPRTKPSPSAAVPLPSVAPSATVQPSAAPSIPVTTAAAGPSALLAGPGSLTLTGTIDIDASYAISAGVGRLISNNSGNAVAIAEAGLISNNSGNLIANNGGGLISDKGFGLIGAQSAGFVSGRYALSQAAAGVAVGAVLPAAGMLVGLVSLKDGQALPVGLDASGAPVYALYSNSSGGYTFYLPQAMAGNVRVVARLPGAAAEVASRMTYDVLARAQASARVDIDEDTAVTTRFLRSCFNARMEAILSADDVSLVTAEVTKQSTAVPDIVLALVDGFAQEINAESKASGLQKASAAVRADAAARIMDRVLQHMVLDEVMITKEGVDLWTGPPAPAIATLVGVMERIRIGVTAAVTKDPDFFKKQAYMVATNARRAAAQLPPYDISKPSDLGAYLVTEFLTRTDSTYAGMEEVFESIGLSEQTQRSATRTSNTQVDTVSAATVAVVNALMVVLFTNEGGAKDEAVAFIRAYKPTQP